MSSTITRRTEEVLIFQGDDATAIEAARRDFNRVTSQESVGTGRLNDKSPIQEAAEAFDAVVAEATERAVVARVQALGRKSYRGLLADHPPREGNEDDTALGFNRESFFDAIAEFFDLETGEKTVIEPHFESRDALVAWLDNLNDGDFSQIASAAVRVNEGTSPDPKASLASQVARMFDAILQPPGSTD